MVYRRLWPMFRAKAEKCCGHSRCGRCHSDHQTVIRPVRGQTRVIGPSVTRPMGFVQIWPASLLRSFDNTTIHPIPNFFLPVAGWAVPQMDVFCFIGWLAEQ
jgi:hypothetical protein